MSYEDAPATKLLASHCCVCGRPLRDAQSVEAGIGPDCAERLGAPYGFAGERGEANTLIHQIAAREVGPVVEAAIQRLAELGYHRLVEILKARLEALSAKARIEIVDVGGRWLELSNPRPVADQLEAIRAIPGRRWLADRGVSLIPVASKRALFAALQKAYPGAIAKGPNGLFRIPAAS